MEAETLFTTPADFQTRTSPIKVVMADDHQLFMGGISGLLNEVPGIMFCASFLNGSELLNWYKGSNADVILMDIHMPVLNGIETSKQILIRFPAARIIILSVDDDPKVMRLMYDIGAYAYLLKDIEPDGFIQTILKVHSGEKVFPENFTVNSRNSVRIDDEMADGRLSAREKQVLKLISKGKNNSEIAAELNISPSTVKKHRENMMRKLGATNLVQLISNVSFKDFFK